MDWYKISARPLEVTMKSKRMKTGEVWKKMFWDEEFVLFIIANISFQGVSCMLLFNTSVRPFVCPLPYSSEITVLFSMKLGIKMHLAIGNVFMYAWWPWDEGQGRYEGKNPIYTLHHIAISFRS